MRENTLFGLNHLPTTTKKTPLTILFVGDLTGWQTLGKSLPNVQHGHFCDYEELTQAYLWRISPDIVLSPLFGPTFDAVSLGQLLMDLGFDGVYRAVTQPVPNPRLIVNEVLNQAAGLDFDLFFLDLVDFQVLS